MKEKINNVIKTIINKDDHHEFKPVLSEIEDSPVSPLGRFTFWVIVFVIMVTILWLTLGKVDIVVSARGLVIPDGEAKIIQPLDTGVISKIPVKEGDFVKQGQVLMEIDPAVTEPELESVRKNLEDTLLEIKRLNASAEGNAFDTANETSETAAIQQNLYNASMSAMRNKIEAKKIDLSKTQDNLNAVKAELSAKKQILGAKKDQEERMKNVLDVIAYDDYQNILNEIKILNAEITKLNYQIKELNSKKVQTLKEINAIEDEFKAQSLEKLADKTKTANELKSNAEQIIFRNTKQTIVSPCDGYVDKLFIHTIGGVVTPAQQLLALTPVNTPLLIKTTVLNQDIGFVKEGMRVSVKIDTFNFQKYGMIEGKVKTVSKNSIEDEKFGPVYEVYIIPLTHTLKVEGKNENIRTGMSLTAEINVGKRRIIEFFIYPLIKYLDEGMSVR